MHRSEWHLARALALWIAIPLAHAQTQIGREVAIPQHLENGQEFQISLTALLDFGKQLFMANWTIHEGQGRPLAKGVGTPTPLSDPSSPLVFPRNFNRFSAPDANSCAGCHNIRLPAAPATSSPTFLCLASVSIRSRWITMMPF
jgi:hypothetical protein